MEGMKLTVDELRHIADAIDYHGDWKLGRKRVRIKTEHGTQEVMVHVAQKSGLVIESIKTLLERGGQDDYERAV